MRLIELEDRRMELKVRLTRAEGKVKNIKSDIAFQRTQLYDNVQKALWKAEADLEKAAQDFKEHIDKIDKIKTYLKHYTI
jgi:dGTP triphosphohydrolase